MSTSTLTWRRVNHHASERARYVPIVTGSMSRISPTLAWPKTAPSLLGFTASTSATRQSTAMTSSAWARTARATGPSTR